MAFSTKARKLLDVKPKTIAQLSMERDAANAKAAGLHAQAYIIQNNLLGMVEAKIKSFHSKKEVAMKLNVSTRTLDRVANGTANPLTSTTVKMARGLGIKPTDLLYKNFAY